MMKFQFIFLLFFWIALQSVKAQTANYILVGKVDSLFESRYAFLYLPERKITLHKPIANSAFKFTVEKKADFETSMLYFGIDSTKKYSDIQLNRRPGFRETVMVVLEDSVYISVNNDLKTAEVKGGVLNKDLVEMNDAIKSGDYLNFFSMHPNSQVSLLFLKSLTYLKKSTMFTQYLDYELYYQKLSENLRKSPEGLGVWDMIVK